MREYRKKLILLAALLAVIMLLLAGCSVLEAVGLLTTQDLYISEVVTSNSYSLLVDDIGSPDWIEIHNASSNDINLSGYKLVNDQTTPSSWTFPDVTIKAGGYLLVYAEKTDIDYGDDVLCTGFKLPKSGVSIALANAGGSTINKVTVPELPTDISWGLYGSRYQYMDTATPGAENVAGSDSLDSLVAQTSNSLIINELVRQNISLPDKDGDMSQWVELYNASSDTIQLSDYYLSDNTGKPGKWRLPEQELASGGYIVIFLSGKDIVENGEAHASFKIGSDEFALILSNSVGQTVDALHWDNTLPEYVAYGRMQDGQTAAFAEATPGAANTAAAVVDYTFSEMDDASPVKMTELLVRNGYSIMDEDGDRSDWVELYNFSSGDISLKSYCLSDNSADLFKWSFPDVTIKAGEYKVIFLSGKDRHGEQLHTSFKLSSSDTHLILTDVSTFKTQTIEMPKTSEKNVSYGLATDGQFKFFPQPTPGAANTTKGFAELASVEYIDSAGIWINEVSGVGAKGSRDWIEIANGSSGTVSLNGYYLSDDIDEPTKWQMQNVSVSGGGYSVLYASDKPTEQGADVAPFSISASGETIMLSSPDGNVIDVFETGVISPSISSGRISGQYDGKRVFFASKTPGTANNASYYFSYAPQVTFSKQGGYIQGAISVEMDCPLEGASIYYTTDGSRPTKDDNLYTAPVQINDTSVLKAIAFYDGKLPSDMTVATYLNVEKHTVPIVCLSGDQSDINTAYSVTQMDVKVEREAYIEYYEADGSLGVSFPAGIRVAGASQRTAAQKSLNVYLRGRYGRSSVTYPFFEGGTLTTFESITLRSSGQDRASARIRDAFASRAVEGMNIDAAKTTTVVVYINGRYWGLYDLKENQNEPFLADNHGVDADLINIVRRNSNSLAGTNTEFKNVRAYARTHDISNDANYQKLLEWVDEDAFIDYMAAQTFFSNSDMYNQKYWRATDYSVKWRPIFFDLDWCLREGSVSRNIIGAYFRDEGVPSANGSMSNMDIPAALIENDTFREKYIKRYAELLNTQFAPERLVSVLDKLSKEMEPEMRAPYAHAGGTPSSVSVWKNNVDDPARDA